jgi:uncharacterized iron-regulated membrane protein
MKTCARLIHLWSGLIFGTILVVLGLTGSALSWIDELDALLNPGLLQVTPRGTVSGPETTEAMTAMLSRDPRYGRPTMVELPAHAGDVFVAWYRPAAAAGAVSRQVMVDPATLQVTGERNWGETGFTRPLLMPTLFHIHRYLVAGDTGKTVVAVTGVALALMVLSGIIVWWPRMARTAWLHALAVRHGGSWPRFSFQLHRAGGFFAAPLLLVTAVSGVHFNMPQWVTPMVNAVAAVTPNAKVSNRSAPGAAVSVADAQRAAQARFPEAQVSRVSLPAKAGQPYEFRVRQPDELRQGPGATRISVDSGDASVLRVIDPERAAGGDRFLSWLFPLHTGEAFGLAGRIFISLFGLVPLAFFVTGLVVWVKLRRMKLGV